jgi:hypothetical protein
MPTNIEGEIRTKTEAFAAALTVLVRRAALEAAVAALGGGAPGAAPALVTAKRGRGRPRKSPTPAAPAPAAPAAKTLAAKAAKTAAPVATKPVSAKRAPGAKRPPAELAKLTEKLGEYITAHPGVRMEALSKALATPAKELRFPVVKLVRAKKVRTEGQKQNMAYFPA